MGIVLEALKSRQIEAAGSLAAVLELTHFHLWKAGGRVCPYGTRFLIGVATWSSYDWAMLDILAGLEPDSLCRVDVFDVNDCKVADYKTQAGFEGYVPGIGAVYHTPVVGRWQDGVLVDKASGFRARELLAEWFGVTLNATPTSR